MSQMEMLDLFKEFTRYLEKREEINQSKNETPRFEDQGLRAPVPQDWGTVETDPEPEPEEAPDLSIGSYFNLPFKRYSKAAADGYRPYALSAPSQKDLRYGVRRIDNEEHVQWRKEGDALIECITEMEPGDSSPTVTSRHSHIPSKMFGNRAWTTGWFVQGGNAVARKIHRKSGAVVDVVFDAAHSTRATKFFVYYHPGFLNQEEIKAEVKRLS